MSSYNDSCVSGEILIPEEVGTFTGATAHIILEDVSRLDISAQAIAQQTITDICHEQGSADKVAFSLPGGRAVNSALYSIRVHLTFYGDGQIHQGDFISTQSYPVLTQSHPCCVLITLTEVI
jgi:uncharacterized lipoprotein YbaY